MVWGGLHLFKCKHIGFVQACHQCSSSKVKVRWSSLVQTFMVLRGWIFLIFMIPWLFLNQQHREADILEWKVLSDGLSTEVIFHRKHSLDQFTKLLRFSAFWFVHFFFLCDHKVQFFRFWIFGRYKISNLIQSVGLGSGTLWWAFITFFCIVCQIRPGPALIYLTFFSICFTLD